MNQSLASRSLTITGTTPLYGCEMETNSATVHICRHEWGGFHDTDRLSDDGCERSNSGGATSTIPGPSPRRALGRSAAADSCNVELCFRSSERVTSSLGRDDRELSRSLLGSEPPDNLACIWRRDHIRTDSCSFIPHEVRESASSRLRTEPRHWMVM